MVWKGVVVLELAFYFLADKHRVVDVAGIHLREELGEANFFILLAGRAGAHHLPQQDSRHHNYRPEKYRLNRRIHWSSSKMQPLRSTEEKQPQDN